jgi:hypothetical protein
MGMTMRVYDLDSKTGAVVRERASVTVRPGNKSGAPMMSSAYPPCGCPRCRAQGKSR